jgi:hypothetical protein
MNKMRRFQVWIGVAAIGAGFAMAQVMPGSRTPSPAIRIAPTVNQPLVADSLKVYIDPATGRIVPPPSKASPDLAAKAAFDASHDGLVEEPGTTAAGGFKVDARGRFHSAVMARIGPGGKPVVSCAPGNAPSPAR